MWNPAENWQQQGSFIEPVAIPAADPADDPLVCWSLNASWLPYVVGSMMQLVQPTTWATGDATALQNVLTAATELIERAGTAGDCVPVQFRFTVDCVLQYSLDGGSTWADTPGWDTYAHTCFVGPEGPTGETGPAGGFTPGPPENPAGNTTAQLACNISGYLAEAIIQASIASAVSAISAGATIVVFAAELAGVVLGLGALSGLLAGAAYILYQDIEAGTLSDYSAASTSGTLRSELICAIYSAIAADGYVTDGNYAAVLTAIAAVAYTPSSVVSTITDYVTALTATGLEQIQPTGALATYNCDGCTGTAHWCYTWDFRITQGPWTLVYSPGADGHWVSGTGWVADHDGLNWEVDIQWVGTAITLSEVELGFDRECTDIHGISFIHVDHSGSTVHSDTGWSTGSPSPQAEVFGFSATSIDTIQIRVGSNYTTCAAPVITGITLKGNGANPFGANNCLY